MKRALVLLAGLVAASGLYGFTIGYAHSDLYARRDVVKLPLLLVGTACICACSYTVTARFLGARLTFGAVLDVVLRMFRDLSILLASLASANALIAWRMHHDTDPRLGEYPLFLGLNFLLVAASGTVALLRQTAELRQTHCLPRRVARSVTIVWLAISLVAGGQLAFYLRPFFGLPASRGGRPPFCLGNEPDVRGATNFFEVLQQLVTHPRVPAWFGSAANGI
jgi:hypothetical protein